MELLAIVAILASVSYLWVGGRLSGMKVLIPARTWAVIAGLVHKPKVAMRAASVSCHKVRTAKRGYYYVDTSR